MKLKKEKPHSPQVSDFNAVKIVYMNTLENSTGWWTRHGTETAKFHSYLLPLEYWLCTRTYHLMMEKVKKL